MTFDVKAFFYEKVSDKKPRYEVPLGLMFSIRDGREFEECGFITYTDNGYLDYVKEWATAEDLKTFATRGYKSEIQDVLNSGIRFQKITMWALEIESFCNTIYKKEFHRYGILVKFDEFTEPDSTVHFINRAGTNDSMEVKIPLGMLKAYFKVLTQDEVYRKIKQYRVKGNRSFEALKAKLDKIMNPQETATLHND